LYVALTRARDRLSVTLPLRSWHRKHALSDDHSDAQPRRSPPPELFPPSERAGGGFGDNQATSPVLVGAVATNVWDGVRLWD
jgi:hypothetical protein